MNKEKDYKGYFADCYVLTEKRNLEFVCEFLETFIPNREESADAYEIPQYGNEITATFKTANDLISYLSLNQNEPHTIYWRNLDKSELRHAMCFFTIDNFIILGLSTETKHPNTEIEDSFFERLKSFSESDFGYITYEEPAPNSEIDFKELVKKLKR